eukprot:CAMPEP_0196786216 /NCGR_PEP_ID=MMETSP1104-20130614/20928_1 /TAXON_ID=33652 /ORGANISM="Cafeteria sp., Strain Caron Lab Isolate" /LENGTH=60 /DNA_ID=CAMNT_0042156531 /DNA_START=43 /DNA_END=222 /DNA_ORIENTATION=-
MSHVANASAHCATAGVGGEEPESDMRCATSSGAGTGGAAASDASDASDDAAAAAAAAADG